MLEPFCFSDEKVPKILQKYMIEKVHIYRVLTDTDSTFLKFLFVSKPDSAICENNYRDIIFEIIIASEVYNWFDTSHKHWEREKKCEKRIFKKMLGILQDGTHQ